MDRVRILEIKKSVFADNDEQADRLRDELREKGVFLLNLMSSPGSGKTTTLVKTIEMMKDSFRIGVMEADIDSDVDAKTIYEAGYPSVQLHTGGMCHLDAQMSRQGMKALYEAAESMGRKKPELLILENVGNLVCPAEFDTGSDLNLVILSVPEGDDKPLKYPLMFEKADLVVINKMDSLPAFDFDLKKCEANIRLRNEKACIFPISARTGEGISELGEAVAEHVKERLAEGEEK